MTPEQLKFCYAVAQGSDETARSLLPQINIGNHDELGFSPFIICLLLATADPTEVQYCINKLQKLYPAIQPPPATDDKKEIKEILSERLYPEIKASLVHFIYPLASRIAKITTRNANNESNAFWSLCVTRGLQHILTEPYFESIGEDKVGLIQKLIHNLNPYLEQSKTHIEALFPPQGSVITEKRNQPNTIKDLMKKTGLHQHTLPDQVTLLFTSARPLPPFKANPPLEEKTSEREKQKRSIACLA